ncbi:MAG: flavin reductase [Ktedonobacteraceae bacterium]|jgi:flavin reductase (DIM6/NTAB) family NADH-FMN oxidoreductase RutF|nr:flavin reductase [Ktedonobacteraceae bacterium]
MDPKVKRQVLRTYTYGLYVVMCQDGDEVNGFTANWLTQVSFDPPLVAVSVENETKSLPMIKNSRKFTINTLRSGQRDLAGHMGQSALKKPDKLNGISYTARPDGVIIFDEGLAWTACEAREFIPAGDSTLVVAEVVDAGMIADGPSLTMAEAGFRHAG